MFVSTFAHGKFSYIDLSALEDGRIAKPQEICGAEAPSRARQLVKAGDTLFSCVRVYLENISLVDERLNNPVASTAYCALWPNSALEARYLNSYVRSRHFIQRLIPLQRGNSPPAVVDRDVKSQLIPLPPRAEQRRIVAQIDELFAEIAEGEAALRDARKGLDLFRRALLKAAVTGELTQDWRDVNTPSETDHDVLKQIRAERSNSPPRKGRSRSVELASLDVTSLHGLPDGWAWGTVEYSKEFPPEKWDLDCGMAQSAGHEVATFRRDDRPRSRYESGSVYPARGKPCR